MSKNIFLFDLDGTLTDPKEGITKSVQYSLRKLGIEADCEELIRFIGPPLKHSYMDFYNLDDEKSEVAIRYYRERYTDIGIFENRCFDGALEVLERLKNQGKTLALATSKPTVFACRICDKYNMTQYLDAICGSELDGTSTGKKEVIANALKAVNGSASDAIMIGDRKFDILGAKAHSMASVGVTFGYAEENELERAGADYIIHDIKELLDLQI